VVGDIYMTLIHTAVLHGQNPLAYLTALMSHPQAVAAAPSDWMPWNYRETLTAPVVAPPIPPASDTAAAGPTAPEPVPEPPATALPIVTTAATTPTTAPLEVVDVQEPAPAPGTSAAPHPQTADKVHAKPSSRSSRRHKPPLLPPPAFVLFTLLWLLVHAALIRPAVAHPHRSSPATLAAPPTATALSAGSPASSGTPRMAGLAATVLVAASAEAPPADSTGPPRAPA
jgi:hypothetical protein